MRQWDKPPRSNKPAALIDRRQIILGCLTLLGMAVLLIVGLTPRSAAAPRLDTAQVGGADAPLLAEDCALVQRMTYTPCGHSLTRRQGIPPELVGMDRGGVEVVYADWQVTGFAPNTVEMERALDMYCPAHVVLKPDESGRLCIYQNKYGDALALIQPLDAHINDLPEVLQEELRPGKPFDTQTSLTLWLESAES